jgi:hypothetical protein
MSLRKYGAIRYGFIAVTAVVAFNQNISVEPLIVSVSLPEATLSSPGTSVHVPYQRPVAQRGIRFYGPPLPVASATAGATLSAGTLNATASLPAATASAGASTVSAGTLNTTVSLPAAARSAGGVSLSAGTLNTTVSLPAVTTTAGSVSRSAGTLNTTVSLPAATLSTATTRSSGTLNATVSLPTATASGGAVSVAAGTLNTTVSLPTATLSAGGAPGTGLPLVFRRPVFQRGYRAWGPPSFSTTPELNRTVAVDPLQVTVSLPTASAVSAGDPRLPASFFRIRQAIKAREIRRPSVIAAYGAIDQLAPSPLTATATPLAVTVSLPAATIVSGGAPATVNAPQLWRLRQVVKPYAYIGQVAKAKRIQPHLETVPDLAQGLSGGTLNTTVSLPTATATPGAVSLSAGTLNTTVSLPAVTISSGTVRQAGTLNACVSLPPVTVTAGAVSRAAGTLVAAVSLPAATRQASITRAAGTLGTPVSLPTATLTVGTAIVQAGTLVATVSLPDVRVLGASEIPANIFDTTIESRLPDHALATTLNNTVESLDPDRGIEVTT